MTHTVRREDPSFVDRAPILVTEEVTIDAPPAAVWPALADAEAWTEWFTGMREARYTSPEPHGVGSTRQVAVKSLRVDEEILAFDPAERFAFCVTAANVAMLAAMVEVVTLDAADGDRTRVVYRQAVELNPWFRPLTPLIRRQLQAGLRSGLPGLSRWVAARR